MHYVYVIWNQKNDEFYLGYSEDPWKRLEGHNQGDTKSTQGRKWELVYVEGYINRKYAFQREKQLKEGRMRSLLKKRIRESMVSE